MNLPRFVLSLRRNYQWATFPWPLFISHEPARPCTLFIPSSPLLGPLSCSELEVHATSFRSAKASILLPITSKKLMPNFYFARVCSIQFQNLIATGGRQDFPQPQLAAH